MDIEILRLSNPGVVLAVAYESQLRASSIIIGQTCGLDALTAKAVRLRKAILYGGT